MAHYEVLAMTYDKAFHVTVADGARHTFDL